MKIKCNLEISNKNNEEFYLGVNCSYGFLYCNRSYECLKYIGGKSDLIEWYKNMDMNKIINQVRQMLLSKFNIYEDKEIENIIKQFEQKGKNIIIEINK